MNTLKTKINDYLSRNCVLIFAFITLLIILFHTPFWDETHAFSIARLKLSEIFYLTRIEGHTFLWYLILKPFSSLNLYPYSMLFLNWIFCVLAIYVLWKKAPFSPFIKTLITFSTPFLYYFAPIARCYSIGILFLFLACAYYRKRFKKPYLFALLLSLAMNTSVMAMIGAFYLILIYIFDLILKLKHKTFELKKFYGVLFIFLACLLLILAQFMGLRSIPKNDYLMVLSTVFGCVIFPQALNLFPLILHTVTTVAFYYFVFVIFKNTKRGFFFISMTYLTLFYVFLMVYSGNHWNHYFYFVYLIIFFWIFGRKILKIKFAKGLFVLILILFLFPNAVLEDGKMNYIYSSKSKLIANQIIKNNELKDAKLFALDWWSDVYPGALVYLEKNNIFLYDLHNRKRNSFDSIKDTFLIEHELIDFDEFSNYLDDNSYLLVIDSPTKLKLKNIMATPKENGDFIFKTKNKSYHLKLVDFSKETRMCIFKIIEI